MIIRYILVFILFWNFLDAFELEDIKNLNIYNIKGNFTQEKILKGYNQTLTTKGIFELKNNELYWTTQVPFLSPLKITQEGVWQYKNNQWEKINQKYDKELFLSLVYLDFEKLKKQFEIKLEGNFQQWNIELLPKDLWLKKIFSSIQIQGGDFITRMTLYEKNGDTTINTFFVP
ncbi:MAG: outer membrane lipoprotein carrier protein LolA [Helicobacter sp.]|nr:outer membrane lipoprotein carrier protein LolA [Helicobacter sp.]